MQMGCRLRPVPDAVFECLVEVSAPSSDSEDASLISYYPESYEDVDMLQDVVTKFCFPFDADTEMVDAVQHFTFVLTDIDGLYRFGFCRYPPKAKTCLCILSDLPAFDMFYGILNTIAELDNNTKNESLTSKEFLDLILKNNVPEPGDKFIVELPGKDWRRQFNYPDPSRLPSIPENRNLTDYFSAVNPSNMIALFASMMYERRIIVTSKKLSLLTACTYSASSLLYPMHWQHVFIPVIPPSLLDYCCAPMPFLVGVHSSLMKKVRDMPLDDVVILDVDKNKIEVPFDDVENLPSEAVNKLNGALKKSTIAIGDYVSRAFLSAVVVLIGGYRDALKLSEKSEKIVFENDLFINSRPHMKSFLENLLTLQLFERFVHHRLQQLNSGEPIDDVFEEQVGLQAENNPKWATQYKQWVKNRKRDGSQLLSNLSGKTEKATYKANKFIQAGFKNMKNGKYGWKEAVKGIKERKKNLIEYVKGTEADTDQYSEFNRHGGLTKSNSLPLRKIHGVKAPPIPPRKSLGSALHDRIDLSDRTSSDPKKSACPARPPPRGQSRVPPRAPPRPPAPYRSSPNSAKNSPVKIRQSMNRDPEDPPVKDLIDFFDNQDDPTQSKSARNPFEDFKDFDYRSDRPDSVLNPEQKDINTCTSPSKDSDSAKETDQDLLWDTMVSLSDDTRKFLRESRVVSEKCLVSDSGALQNGQIGCSPCLRRKVAVKKTLAQLALERNEENNRRSLTHSESCPSLFDPLAPRLDSAESELRSSSSSKIEDACGNGATSNVDVLIDLQEPQSNINCGDPFVDQIARRHNPKNIECLSTAPGAAQRNNEAASWVANF